jgi:hypothetical protein
MNKAININAGVMLLMSIIFTYSTATLVATSEGPSAYGWGFIFGRAITGVLFPLLIVWVVRAVFRRKPMFTKGAFISWWVLFVLLSIMALLGSMLPPEV